MTPNIRPDKFFGLHLLEAGAITTEMLRNGLLAQARANLPLGRLAIGLGLLTSTQVSEILAEQRRTDRRFGEIAVARGWLTPAQLDDLWSLQSRKWVFLGEWLVAQGYLTHTAMNEHLERYLTRRDSEQDTVARGLAAIQGGTLLSMFLEMSVKNFLRLAGITVKVREVASAHLQTPGGRHLVSQSIGGPPATTFGFLLPDEMIVTIASAMLGEPQVGLNELTLDAAAEFLNVIVGHTCSQLGDAWRGMRPMPPRIEPVPAGADPLANQVWIGLVSAEGESVRPFHVFFTQDRVLAGKPG